ncbi:ABC transporter substrate-binding protein [Aldersonia sp. NBC_00410]|uniref:ABC transporter substrate-binding protein n=1 Tax=Aldersonia sp. NBC_00410 TaxID=2975954 RepID=UPI00225A432D|nr:ABC transporter substrate-binding protein [Aldersonia sp. NBC_00410]MCX5046424.1 ABC transporter substrate-binding protein [Aldersonia sp. NBC_00410]
MSSKRIVVALAVVSLLVVGGCSGRSGTETEATGGSQKESAEVGSGDFGDLSGVCGPGAAKSATAQGVTADEIKVGIFSDVGFTKNPEFVDAAKVFTSWCNAAGGINGRKLVAEVYDTKLMEVRQRMIEACRSDFALVGGGAALDALGVKERLKCLLPDFPAQVVQAENAFSDLQVTASVSTGSRYEPFQGFRQWLLQQKYPESKGAVGIINGDSPVTKVIGTKTVESMQALGATVTYDELYPAAGVSDWTPYAQSIKSKGVKGLVFMGQFTQLLKLEDVLTSMDYKLDWIDATNNAYNQEFIDNGGRSLGFQNSYLDLSGAASLESGDKVPAVRQVDQMYDKYAPGTSVTFPGIRAIAAWVLFAKSAGSCADELTRKCALDVAKAEKEWTAGGLQMPVDLSVADRPVPCYDIEVARPGGWQAADFGPTIDGLYRCDAPIYEYQGEYPKPVTLADIGKSASDVK